ncbi:hypothetical protein BGZ72_002382 [Mortierella alpina]|nr:hypothetical protein BGZ72_002382 [Mortierella alpina]
MATTSFAHHNGARLLSIDGGGVRGIASLIILDEIMRRVQKRLNLEETPLPADYFDLAAGTSSGGINAIMLFRLRMSTAQAIEQYHTLSKEMFRPAILSWHVPTWMEKFVSATKLLFLGTRFNTTKLEQAVDRIVEKHGLDANDKAKKGDAPLLHPNAKKMFLCTTVKNMMETALLRSYVKNIDYPSGSLNEFLQKDKDNITIKLAVKATSAAPTYFPEVRHKGFQANDLIFWDGGLLNNNPIDQLWYERYDLVGREESHPPISCVISLGTGLKKPDNKPGLWFKLIGIASSVVAFTTTSNAKDKKFDSHMLDLKPRKGYENAKYLRFNTPLDYAISLHDYHEIGTLSKKTYEFLQTLEVQNKLDEAVDAICPVPRKDSLMSP